MSDDETERRVMSEWTRRGRFACSRRLPAVVVHIGILMCLIREKVVGKICAVAIVMSQIYHF